MTREELIESLTTLKGQAHNSGGNSFVWDINLDSFNFVIDNAIKVLEQEPCEYYDTYNKTCRWSEVPKEPILDEIRAEIMQLDCDIEDIYYDYNDTVHTICREEVLQIIDRYKVENEDKE